MESFITILQQSFGSLAVGVIAFLPRIIIAFSLLGLGFLVGESFQKVIVHIMRALKIDTFLEGAGVKSFLSRGGIRLDAGAFLGILVKAFIVIAFLIAAFEVVGLSQANTFLNEVVITYIPQVIIATLILLFAAIGANVAKKTITGSTKALGIEAANLLGVVASVALWLFGFIFALAQLGVATQFMQTLFAGIIAMLALAGGLAFGLGGRDAAARFLEKIGKEIS